MSFVLSSGLDALRPWWPSVWGSAFQPSGAVWVELGAASNISLDPRLRTGVAAQPGGTWSFSEMQCQKTSRDESGWANC